MSPTQNDSSTHATASTPTAAVRPKRRRLNFACNYCRSRKTRCDEQQPSCHACRVAGVACVTTDRRRPGTEIERREAGQRNPIETGTPISDRSGAEQRRHAEHSSDRNGTHDLRASEDHVVSFAGERVEPSLEQDHLEDLQVSVSQQNRHVPFQGRLPIIRHHAAQSLVEILTGWLDLALYRLGRSSSGIRTLFRPRRTSRSIATPLLISQPLPNHNICLTLLEEYFNTVNIVYPLLHRERTLNLLAYAQQYGLESFLELHGLALLVQIHLALLLATYTCRGLLSPEYVENTGAYCKSAYGHVLSNGDTDAAVVAAMTSINLRRKSHDTAAWAMLVQTSLATTSLVPTTSRHLPEDIPILSKLSQDERVWWVLYCQEKLSAFELGRASQFPEIRKRPRLDANSLSEEFSDQDRYFAIIASLATVLDEISTRCIRVSAQEEESVSSEDLQAAVFAKVQVTGECQMQLFQWAETLPVEYRPTSEAFQSGQNHSLRNFISMHYNNAHFMLCRNSLLIAQEAVQEVSEVMGKGQPWEHIVRSGHSIPANSARKVLTTVIERTDHILESAISMLPMVIHAAYILYIHTIRHPEARMAMIDRVLIDNALDQITKSALDTHNPDSAVLSALKRFRDLSNGVSSSRTTGAHQTREPTRSPRPEATRRAAMDPVTQTSNTAIDQQPPELFDLWSVDDVGWSPDLPDQIGWDWAAFAQLFPLADGSILDGVANVQDMHVSQT